MEYENESANGELINSEQLQVFNVVDSYCENCGDTTPHHLEGSIKYIEDDELDPDAQCVGAISNKECVICRETEENEISSF